LPLTASGNNKTLCLHLAQHWKCITSANGQKNTHDGGRHQNERMIEIATWQTACAAILRTTP